MDVIGHDDEPDAEAISIGQFCAQMSDDNPFGLIVFQERPTSVARERHEVSMPL